MMFLYRHDFLSGSQQIVIYTGKLRYRVSSPLHTAGRHHHHLIPTQIGHGMLDPRQALKTFLEFVVGTYISH